jgi:hypothetical protein
MIDKVELYTQIKEAANLYLHDIEQMSESELKDNLQYFAEKSKKIADGLLEQFVFSNVAKYTSGSWAIQDDVMLGRFCDFKTGYQSQMLQWIEQHQLEVKEESFDLPQKPLEVEEQNHISPKNILIGGTIIAVGLFIFTNIWIALAAEILSIVLSKVQSMRIQKSAEQRKMEMDHYLVAIENRKNELVNGMISELEKWLDLGETQSIEILKTYNL